MPTFFDRFFGKGRAATAAQAAELRGDLAKAAELYGEADLPEEAARVILLRGDSETDPRARLQFFAQARQFAPADSDIHNEARRKRAELLLALAGDATVSAVARHDVLEAAKDLEAVGEPLRAAEAYARAGDKEGEARALQAAGDVERLEFLLSTEQHKERISRARDDRTKDVDLLIACGRRREALGALDELLREIHKTSNGDFGVRVDETSLRERANGLRARKIEAPIVEVEIGESHVRLVLGREIVIGRSEGTIRVSSNAISRQHLRIFREGDAVVVRDLESRNGTQLRGVNLAGTFPIHEGLELKLGREVPLRITPSEALPGAIEIEVAGQRYLATLGPTNLPAFGFELVAGPDGWVELLARHPAFQGDVELVGQTTLLAGDAIATTRGGAPAIRFVST
ncbi:hypothetical protein AKJ09_10567 [Labilithrix luteola]|uniref:FHA domain-containing protein n=1 Tax=Labilithrix luteola TaxID=1391654 RepID=A0A0K1QDR8_9BACT|nr:FHA domain-containing protein [Labilithrix luteola]AKV03904.1 hypothetical protein AKJ09_10567 [Labilithrix luteola]